jgi:hypothetical protein
MDWHVKRISTHCLIVLVTLASGAARAEDLASAEDPPGLLKCSAGPLESCQVGRENIRLWYRASLEGDTSAQRWMAKCYTDGCNGTLQKNRLLACAWRQVIVRTGTLRTERKALASEVNDADLASQARACDGLSSPEAKAAESQFSWLYHFSTHRAGLR